MWDIDPVSRQTLRQLIEQVLPRTTAALPQGGAGWRAGWGHPNALTLLREQGGILIDLPTLYADLGVGFG